jgi:hypothetical protein
MTDTSNPSPDQDAFADVIRDAQGDEQVQDTRIYQKTLTPGRISALPERCVIEKRPVVCFRVGGIMYGVGEESMPDKPDVVFRPAQGQFEADVYEPDGSITEYAAGQVYLPSGFHEQLLAQFQQLTVEEQQRGHVFSYWFAAVPAANPRGYRWQAANAMLVSRNERSVLSQLKRMSRLTADNMLALANAGRRDPDQPALPGTGPARRK